MPDAMKSSFREKHINNDMLIEDLVGQCEVKHILMLQIKTIINSEIKELQNFNYIGVLLKNCLRIVDIVFILM
jgi:hypothetical protein